MVNESVGLNVFNFVTHLKWIEQGKMRQRPFQHTIHTHGHSHIHRKLLWKE